MKIYTKTGDKGETGLFGGERVSKNSSRIEAYGTVDELNSFIGLTVIECKSDEVKTLLQKIQNQLFVLGSDLATPDTEKNKKLNIKRVTPDFAIVLEEAIDYFTSQLEELKNFILPGGSKASALLQICRTVCRRAERRVIAIDDGVKISSEVIIFLNRLSDLFFVLSRFENKVSIIPDVIWNPKT